MRWKPKERPEWQRWFAWYPVRILDGGTGTWVWWEWVYYRSPSPELGFEYKIDEPAHKTDPLVEQIDSLLELDGKDSAIPPVPALARQLLVRSRDRLKDPRND